MQQRGEQRQGRQRTAPEEDGHRIDVAECPAVTHVRARAEQSHVEEVEAHHAAELLAHATDEQERDIEIESSANIVDSATAESMCCRTHHCSAMRCTQ